jgi:hypothetical protein
MSEIIQLCNRFISQITKTKARYPELYFLLLLILFCSNLVSAQVVPSVHLDAIQIEELKSKNQLTGQEDFLKPQRNPSAQTNFRVTPQTPQTQSTLCNCWIPRDSSWSVVPFDGSPCSGCPGSPPDFRNDDSYTSTPIALPFVFCFLWQQCQFSLYQ